MKKLFLFLAAPFCLAADECVIFDSARADSGCRITSAGDVFSVQGDWDLSKYGSFQIEFAQEQPKHSYFSVFMENADSRPSDGSTSHSRGLFNMKVFLEKPAISFERPIPPAMPVFQQVISAMKGVEVNGLLAMIWPSPYWSYKEAGWGNTIAAWTLDSKRVVSVKVVNLGKGGAPAVRRIVARGDVQRVKNMPEFAKLPPEKFFPFVDKYGQFIHRQWPGKINSDADLIAAREAEDADLAAHPGPKDRNRFGGWTEGPRFEAVGAFTVRKIDGKWWFVDPEGCLWWSHGPVRVSASCGMTSYEGRENAFAFLPRKDSDLGAFYKTRDELLWPYYVKYKVTNTYDFTSANLYRKYGEDWANVWADRAHRRLRSWGANTIANSSDKRVMRLSRTPYCDRIEIKSRPIEGSLKAKAWWPFRDPFDVSFREDLRRQFKECSEALNDPWCFGFFVDNELPWGGPDGLAKWTWDSPEDQPAKKEFRRRLAEKYGKKDVVPSVEDMQEFSLEIAREYFRIVREELKRAAPSKLYLGCRFSGGLYEPFKRIAAEYVDVMSFNYYDRNITGFLPLPAGVDKPIIIGEFHFGALDRGPIRPGIVWLADQKERAATYRRYLESALKDPRFVGAHWHQYADDAPTGRFDGENFQIGWVDVCDTPYPETVEAVRWVGENMYRIRYETH